MRVAIVVFGTLGDRSGGFRYDEYLRRAFETKGHSVYIVSQNEPQGYREQHRIGRKAQWVSEAASLNPDLLLIDELNHASTRPGIQAFRAVRLGTPIIAIVHHLRSDERPFRFRARRTERRFLREMDGWICNSTVTLGRVWSVSRVRRSSTVAFPAAYSQSETPDDAHRSTRDRSTRGTAARRSREVDREGEIGRAEEVDRIRQIGRAGEVGFTGKIGRAGEVGDPVDARQTEEADRAAEVRVITVGNVIPRKNVHLVIDEVRRRSDTQLDVYGDLTSDPGYTKRLQRAIGDAGGRIRLHGRVPNEELAASFERADVLAVPSSYEGFGIVYVEALRYGVPVIAARRGGARDIVVSDRVGRLVPPRRRAVRRALRDMIAAMHAENTPGSEESAVAGAGSSSVATPNATDASSSIAMEARRVASLFPPWEVGMAGAVRFAEAITQRFGTR
jgi:glycosyltransferase involved in cell wall biosynthesis